LTTSSIEDTDGYKFSMGQAGAPLRTETFHGVYRRGGWQYMPYDLEKKVAELLPEPATDEEYAYLADNNYRLTEGMRQAIKGDLKVRAIPQGAWFGNQEPYITGTGPSFLASWPEAKITWLNYGVQLATYLKSLSTTDTQIPIQIISDEHQAVVDEVLDLLEMAHPTQRDNSYPERVLKAAREIVDALDGGDAALRLIEGGMRSAICMDHHRMVLAACREVGITRTSNVRVARELGMIPSGTAGHEHSQRSGSDPVAYASYMDRVCGLVSCLSDTTSTLNSGLPATIAIALANTLRDFLFRLDSGDRMSYFHIAAVRFMQEQIENVIINVAGDVNAQMIREFEPLRKIVKWEANRLSYMIGGQLTANTLPTPFTRSRVAAVWKLSMTGGRPVRKLGDDVDTGDGTDIGKSSTAGHPVTWRRLRGDGPIGIIGQLGEPVAENYILLNGNPEAAKMLTLTRAEPAFKDGVWRWGGDTIPYVPSPATRELNERCLVEMSPR
jgi:nicotinic acid phosphoribosyltransferase